MKLMSSLGRSHDRSQGRSHERSQGRSHDHSHDHSQGRSHDHSHDHSQGRSHDHSHEHHRHSDHADTDCSTAPAGPLDAVFSHHCRSFTLRTDSRPAAGQIWPSFCLFAAPPDRQIRLL